MTRLNCPEITQEEIRRALNFAADQVILNLEDYTYHFQSIYTDGNFYNKMENVEWTTGFWTGEIWLAYEHTGEEQCKKAGMVHMESFLERINNKTDVDHHDMGFLYSPSCVAGYKLTGSRTGREAALKAAKQLVSRFQPTGEFIQAWGKMGARDNYRLIIDCLMNLPLLYWAYGETKDETFREAAEKHITTTMKHVIREDGSTWHTFFFDPETGDPDHGATKQGYRDGSAWGRGQAWGIYGSAMAYRYTGREEYIQIFKKVTEYYLSHLPADLVPYWDLEFKQGSVQPRDSSSGVIAACGMLEMAAYLPEEDREYYRSEAGKLLKVLYGKCAVKDREVSDGLLLHGTYSKHSKYNQCGNHGIDECNAWGDYFYMEALTRLSKKWEPYW
ncbi:glycoside hydrolase family 88 protein [Lachnospiraceae bacterium 54-53]